MLTRAACALGVMLLAGCAGESIPAPLAADHPANPAAAESELPPRSDTLALAPAEPVPGAADRITTGGDRSTGSPGEGHAHHQHGDAQPQPGATTPATVTPGTGPDPHAGHGNHGGVATTRPAGTQPTYLCPMHPEVVSSNPNEPCPRCGMKINKPLRPVTAPGALRAAPAGGHDAHQGDAHQGHGGH